MFFSQRLFRRFSLEAVLTVSFAVAALRWFFLAQVTTLPAIFATQVLHALTYGTFHMASILFMDRLTPDGSKTLGQAVNNAIQYGVGLMAGFFLNGWLYESVGSFRSVWHQRGHCLDGPGPCLWVWGDPGNEAPCLYLFTEMKRWGIPKT